MIFKKNKENVRSENQYRAVISCSKTFGYWSFVVERRVGIKDWKYVHSDSGFASKEMAEGKARAHIKIQKNLDSDRMNHVSYIIYDD